MIIVHELYLDISLKFIHIIVEQHIYRLPFYEMRYKIIFRF